MYQLADYPDLLTVREAQELLRMSKNGIYVAIKEKTVPSIRIGRKVLVPKIAITELVDAASRGTKGG